MNAQNNHKSLFKALFSVSGIVIISKLLGFIKQAICAGYFGATAHTDIISLSEGVVTDIDYLIAQTLITAFIPIYIRIKQEDELKCKKFVSDTLILFAIIASTLVFIIEICALYIPQIIAPTYSIEMATRLTGYIRILAPVLVVIVLVAVFNALLKANSQFVSGESVSLIQSLSTIVLVLTIGKRVGPDTMVVAFFVYSITSILFLGIRARKHWRLFIGNPFSDVYAADLLKMMGPMFFGYAMLYINQQVDKIVVSGLGNGTITSMHYAATLSNFVTAFLGSTCSVAFTNITKNVSSGDDRTAAGLVEKFSIIYITVLLPISILTVLNSKDIVTIVFGRGAFDSYAVDNSTRALMGYACMFVPLVFRELFSRLQYAYKDSKRPMINSSIGICTNIILNLILSRFLGIFGVTLATSISVLLTGLLNIRSSKRINRYISFGYMRRYMFVWIGGVTICVVASFFGYKCLKDINTILRFVIVISISSLAYSVISIHKIKPLIRAIKNRREV